MGRSAYLLIGAAVGAAIGVAVNYLMGPADNTTYDEDYRSRLDAAMEAGELAADQRELELRMHFEQGKLRRPQLPETGPLPSAEEGPNGLQGMQEERPAVDPDDQATDSE